MFKNYFKIAWKVLLRRKVFSFISLFGIAITLATLLILSTMVDNYLYPHGPEKTNQNFLSISKLVLVSENRRGTNNSDPGFKFIKDNVQRLKSPEKISTFSMPIDAASYVEGDKLTSYLRRTDADYWDILDFELVEGRFFTQQEFSAGEMLIVINETTREEFFNSESALDKKLIVNEQSFRVIGVVKDVAIYEEIAFSDMWVPYTTSPSTSYQNNMMSGWGAILYHSNTKMLKEMQSEYVHLLKNDFVTPDPKRYHFAYSGAVTPFEKLARRFYLNNQKSYENGSSKLISMISIFVICFMLLPSINLINLNISRILERSSEIGVRKAFGASSKQLVLQFTIENILITALGGIIGILLSWFILYQVQVSQVIPGGDFKFSLHTLLYGFGMVFIFALISGTYPAYKMSKLHPVAALKGGA